MPHGDDALAALREAVKLSPDNLPLRLHLADTLLGMGRADDADREFRHALTLSGGSDARAKVGLATAFYRQGKNSAALVIVEELVKNPDPPARAHLLYARL